MKLRPVLTGVCALALLVGGAPATAADEAADLTLVVTADGTPHTWSASGVRFGAGPELVGGPAGACTIGGLVDIDPTARTITVTVARAAASVDVSLVVATAAIGGLGVVTPGLSDLTLTATPEVAIITGTAGPASGAGCSTATAVFSYVGPGEPLPPARPLEGVTPGAPAGGSPDATAASAVVAAPTFAG